jgi:hypothetical protein
MDAILSVKNSQKVSTNLILINDRTANSNSSHELRKLGHLVIDSNDIGYAKCLNLGIDASNSEFIGILNSDDLQTPDRLHRQTELMIHEDTTMSICRLKKFHKTQKIYDLSGTQMLGEFNKVQLLLGAYGANASLILEGKEKENLYFHDVEMSDWEFAFRNYPERISYLPEDKYLYRMHPDQATRRKVQTPDWLLDEWSKLFASISEISVPKAVIEACCRPSLLIKLELDDLHILIEVLVHIRSNLLSVGTPVISELNQIILRRFVLAAKKGFLFSRDAHRRLGTNKNSVAIVLSKLAVEFASNGKGTRR